MAHRSILNACSWYRFPHRNMVADEQKVTMQILQQDRRGALYGGQIDGRLPTLTMSIRTQSPITAVARPATEDMLETGDLAATGKEVSVPARSRAVRPLGNRQDIALSAVSRPTRHTLCRNGSSSIFLS
jgi:hypothetical protein